MIVELYELILLSSTVSCFVFYHLDGEIFGFSQWDGVFLGRAMWRVLIMHPRPVNYDLGSKQ